MLGTFPGLRPPGALTYEQYFGLWLNLDSTAGRMTFAVFQALNAVKAERLPASFFEPVSASRKEAEDKAFDWTVSKNVARAMAGMRL